MEKFFFILMIIIVTSLSLYADFHLTQLSPCVDTGDPTSPLDPDETTADMGYYYFYHDYDIKRFSPGWQWISFPRLIDQDIFNEEAEVCEQIYYENSLPGLLQQTDLGPSMINGLEGITGRRDRSHISIDYCSPAFGDVRFHNKFFRHEGYKVKVVDDAESTILIVNGERLESYSLDMQELEDFWLGYYIPYPQNIKNAFGDFWGDVNRVWAEDWYYDSLRNARDIDDPVPVCPANSTEGKVLEYGKMYIVQMYSDVTNFSWENSTITTKPVKKIKPQNFNYIEKADYEAIDILNIPNDVMEIGVYENDECVGAVTVKDTTAQVLVYSDNANRDITPFTFEVITERGTKNVMDNYLTLNQKTGKFEPTLLYAGKQGYSVIKFVEQDENENIVLKPILYSNYPNPFNPATTISFSLPKEDNIKLTIYNIKGQKVKTLYSGIAEKGEHQIVWNGENNNAKQVSSGIYLYKLKTNGNELTRKMLMIK